MKSNARVCILILILGMYFSSSVFALNLNEKIDSAERQTLEELFNEARISSMSQHKKSIELYNELLKRFPEEDEHCIEALLAIRGNYTLMGEYEKAIEKFQELIDEYSTNTTILEKRRNRPANEFIKSLVPVYMGSCYQRKGQYTEAERCYKKARKFADQKLEEARNSPSKFAERKSLYRIHFDSFISLYQEQGKYNKAVKESEERSRWYREFYESGGLESLPPGYQKNIDIIKLQKELNLNIIFPLEWPIFMRKWGIRKRPVNCITRFLRRYKMPLIQISTKKHPWEKAINY